MIHFDKNKYTFQVWGCLLYLLTLAKSLSKGFQSFWFTSMRSHWISCQAKGFTLHQRIWMSRSMTGHSTYCTIQELSAFNSCVILEMVPYEDNEPSPWTQFSLQVKDPYMVEPCPNRYNAKVWEPRDRSRNGLFYHGPQWPPWGIYASHLCDSGLCGFRDPSSGGHCESSIKLQDCCQGTLTSCGRRPAEK